MVKFSFLRFFKLVIVSLFILQAPKVFSYPQQVDDTKSEENFFSIIILVQTAIQPALEAQDIQLHWDIKWDSKIENAHPYNDGGLNKYGISIHGGLYRKAGVSSDVFIFVLCHEIGHILGGSPKNPFFSEMSSEGQADYYATSVCLPLVFNNLPNTDYLKNRSVPSSVQSRCWRAWQNIDQSAICQKSIMAAYDFFEVMFANSKDQISLDKPDLSKVDKTIDNAYPAQQCRFDTVVAGALCNSEKKTSEKIGLPRNCSSTILSERQGSRPACWFNDSNLN